MSQTEEVWEKIPHIERWFANDDWDMPEEEKIEEEEKYPAKFFDFHVPTFWAYLSLIEVINLARAYRSAAYSAYYTNQVGFRIFCDMAWNEGKMDLSQFPEITREFFIRLRAMFSVDEIIFPEN